MCVFVSVVLCPGPGPMICCDNRDVSRQLCIWPFGLFAGTAGRHFSAWLGEASVTCSPTRKSLRGSWISPSSVFHLIVILGRPMAVYTICPFLGPELGPILSGWVLYSRCLKNSSCARTLKRGANSFINQHLHWRWTFYVLIIWSSAQAAALIIVSSTP